MLLAMQMIGEHIVIIISSIWAAPGSDKDNELDNSGKCHHGGFGVKTLKTTTREELLTMLREKERTIKNLRAEMDYMKHNSKPSKI